MVSSAEFERRQDLAKQVVAELKGTIDGAILVGSMAYGTHITVKEDSDVDIVCIRSFRDLKDLKNKPLLDDHLSAEMMRVAQEGVCDTFSVEFLRDEVRLSIHFWNYSCMGKVIDLQKKNRRYVPDNFKLTSGLGIRSISGDLRVFDPNIEQLEEGYLMDLPIALQSEDDLFLFVQPVNLLLDHLILYDTGIQIAERTNFMLQNLAARYQCIFGPYDEKKPLLNVISDEVKSRLTLQQKIDLETGFVKALISRR